MSKLISSGLQFLGAVYGLSVVAMDFYYMWLWIKDNPFSFVTWFMYGWIWTSLKALFWPIVEFLI